MDPHLTDLEQLVMLALLRVGAHAHGAAVQEVLAERAGRVVTLGSLYNTLTRMEERGLVQSALGDPTPERGGKAKRLYHVTTRGHAALAETRRVYERMWTGLPEAPSS
jgi:DNA-binding PadR family transcriptional regulator